jgi:hypothetical protein
MLFRPEYLLEEESKHLEEVKRKKKSRCGR